MSQPNIKNGQSDVRSCRFDGSATSLQVQESLRRHQGSLQCLEARNGTPQLQQISNTRVRNGKRQRNALNEHPAHCITAATRGSATVAGDPFAKAS